MRDRSLALDACLVLGVAIWLIAIIAWLAVITASDSVEPTKTVAVASPTATLEPTASPTKATPPSVLAPLPLDWIAWRAESCFIERWICDEATMVVLCATGGASIAISPSAVIASGVDSDAPVWQLLIPFHAWRFPTAEYLNEVEEALAAAPPYTRHGWFPSWRGCEP